MMLTRIACTRAASDWLVGELKELLEACGAERLSRGAISLSSGDISTLEPPEHLRPLWMRGLLNYTPEYGCELHPAALVLPLLEQVRHKLCDELGRHHGAGWSLRWCSPQSEEEHAELRECDHVCSWGYLSYLIRTCHQLKPQRRWIPLVQLGRRIRNQLAHYRPVEFADYRSFWTRWRRDS